VVAVYSVWYNSSVAAAAYVINVTKLVMATQPSDAAFQGTAFDPQPVVKLQDADGNDVKTPGVLVTAAIKSGTGVLSGTLTTTTDSEGIAAFAGLNYDKVENITIEFTSEGLTPVVSSQIEVARLE